MRIKRVKNTGARARVCPEHASEPQKCSGGGPIAVRGARARYTVAGLC